MATLKRTAEWGSPKSSLQVAPEPPKMSRAWRFPTPKHLLMKSCLLKKYWHPYNICSKKLWKHRRHELCSPWHSDNGSGRLHSPHLGLPDPLAQALVRALLYKSRELKNQNKHKWGQSNPSLKPNPKSPLVSSCSKAGALPQTQLFSILWRKCKMNWYLLSLSVEHHFHFPNSWFTGFGEIKHQYQEFYTSKDKHNFSTNWSHFCPNSYGVVSLKSSHLAHSQVQ